MLLQKQLLWQLNVVQCYRIARNPQQLHSRTSCSSFDYSHDSLHSKSQKASVSQLSSIHFPPCPDLKRLVRTIHLAIWRESWCREDQGQVVMRKLKAISHWHEYSLRVFAAKVISLLLPLSIHTDTSPRIAHASNRRHVLWKRLACWLARVNWWKLNF